MIDYIKKNFDFIHRQNSDRASKLTIKKYFFGIHAGISLSWHVKKADGQAFRPTEVEKSAI